MFVFMQTKQHSHLDFIFQYSACVGCFFSFATRQEYPCRQNKELFFVPRFYFNAILFIFIPIFVLASLYLIADSEERQEGKEEGKKIMEQ